MRKVSIDGLDFEVFIEYEQIQKSIRLIGLDINVKYKDKNPVFLGVLNGCFMFMADLMKQIHIPSEVSFVKLASYNGTDSEELKELLGVSQDLKGREIIIVEDIVDTGKSLHHTIQALEREGVASISVCTLLFKPTKLIHSFDSIMYVGFEIGEEFVVGYGLDYNGQCRNLKDIYKVVSP